MSMVKLLGPHDWDCPETPVQLVKYAGGGLHGTDFSVLVKRAGYQFADAVRALDLGAGDVPVHLLALGASAHFGCNRNGDAFSANTCRACHPTFVKHARVYRFHCNRDPAKSYGLVKLSAYNEDMHRVELLVTLNGTAEAARRNGGLVADEELEKLASGRDLPVSMSCLVTHDVCASCGNKAKNRTEYCTGTDEGGHCKRGGVRHRMCQVCADGHILHVDNPDPKFFDISAVGRPADRIAYAFGKVAAELGKQGGAALAEEAGVYAPPDLLCAGVMRPTVAAHVALAYDLAALEKSAATSSAWSLAFVPEVQEDLPWSDHGGTPAELLTALTHAKVAMPLAAFLQVAAGQAVSPHAKEAVAVRLPGVYGRMLADGSITEHAEHNLFMPEPGTPRRSLQSWMHKRAEDYSIARPHAERRRLRGALYHAIPPAPRSKSAATTLDAAERLARAYALYKLAFVYAHADDPDYALLKELVVRGHYAA